MMQLSGSLLLSDAARHMPHHLKVRRTLRGSVATGTLRKALLHGTVGNPGVIYAGGIFRLWILSRFSKFVMDQINTQGWNVGGFGGFGVCHFFLKSIFCNIRLFWSVEQRKNSSKLPSPIAWTTCNVSHTFDTVSTIVNILQHQCQNQSEKLLFIVLAFFPSCILKMRVFSWCFMVENSKNKYLQYSLTIEDLMQIIEQQKKQQDLVAM